MKGTRGDLVAFRLDLEYDGSRYQGWQKQGAGQTAQGVKTVAGTLERCLYDLGLDVLTLGGSGRTDAGVHARRQVAHLHLRPAKGLSPERLRDHLDRELPYDIALLDVQGVDQTFHARHDALARTYDYQLCLRKSAFAKPYAWWLRKRLDVARLQDAWSHFQGFHDMSAFADLTGEEDPRCEIQTCDLEVHGGLLILRVRASHFLRKQVRRMVGAAVHCGIGEGDPRRIARDLQKPTDAANLHWGALAAPSAGLFLTHVQYGHTDTAPPMAPLVLVP